MKKIPLKDITDNHLIEMARLATQLLKADFKIVKRNRDLIHIEFFSSGDNSIYHVGFSTDHATLNVNHKFLESEHDKFEIFKINIGEIYTSSLKKIPYIAVVDFLRSKNYDIPQYFKEETFSKDQTIDFGRYILQIANRVNKKNNPLQEPLNEKTGEDLLDYLFNKWIKPDDEESNTQMCTSEKPIDDLITLLEDEVISTFDLAVDKPEVVIKMKSLIKKLK